VRSRFRFSLLRHILLAIHHIKPSDLSGNDKLHSQYLNVVFYNCWNLRRRISGGTLSDGGRTMNATITLPLNKDHNHRETFSHHRSDRELPANGSDEALEFVGSIR
jgi:hypothetical protein